MWRQVYNQILIQKGGDEGMLIHGDAAAMSADLLSRYARQIQCIYIDPPFATGDQFTLKMRVGEKGWATEKQYITLPAYSDKLKHDDYIEFMRQMLILSRDLLNETGVFFIHIDHRMSAQMRLLCNEIFGEKNFINEIIWVYQTGGRATHHFSRKHDTILFYGKSKQYYFDIKSVPLDRASHRKNHMKRQIDEDGRPYRSIKTNGKVYKYYDDEPTYPSDVWDDVSHLQQKDPQRTGYDTQKPIQLLNRIIAATTRPGDIVADLCCGSGTTMVAANMLARRFLGVDKSSSAVAISKKRLADTALSMQWPTTITDIQPKINIYMGLASYLIKLQDFTLPPDEMNAFKKTPNDFAFMPLDAVDQWSAGLYKDGVFMAYDHSERTKHAPALKSELSVPILTGQLAVCIIDILGRRSLWLYDA